MVLPIVTYGKSVLRKVAKDIDQTYEGLNQLIENMFDTMYKADGIGLAAPQVDRSIRLFVIDATPLAEDNPLLADFKKVFINAKILKEWGEEWFYNEGCLSVPGLREEVKRPANITIEYVDENWVKHTEDYDGEKARIIQHEYDHLQGIIFTDKVNPLKKQLLRGRLSNIERGKFSASYKTKSL
jgi:peptide deformylase